MPSRRLILKKAFQQRKNISNELVKAVILVLYNLYELFVIQMNWITLNVGNITIRHRVGKVDPKSIYNTYIGQRLLTMFDE